MGKRGIEVGTGDVGLDLVPLNGAGRSCMVDRVQHREQLTGLVAVAEHREGNDRPDGAMTILAAVLADARWIALDVSGVERRQIEWWGEEQDQPVIAANEVLIDRRHGLRGVDRIAGAGDHAPRLCDRIDAAFGIQARAERGSVVEIGPAIPLAVPVSYTHLRAHETGRNL